MEASVMEALLSMLFNGGTLESPLVTWSLFVPPESFELAMLTLELEFVKKGTKSEQVDAALLSTQLKRKYINQVLTVGQKATFEYHGTNYILTVNRGDVEGQNQSNGIERGMLSQDTYIVFEASNASGIKIVNQREAASSNIFKHKEFNLGSLGIGGLGAEFADIFRRAFASRVFPPHVTSRLGIKHVKGMLLFGPPGTGKTLMARQIGKMLNGKDPKIVNQREAASSNIFKHKEFNLESLGIGGLGAEFADIFRRAFASRVFPPHVTSRLGIKHVKGMLLFGPPGTGKTLMARQIGKMLNGKDPKIVNGPEVLSKFVGETEKNVRDLFADAEQDQRTLGDASELHVIIFDEIDAICKSRGSTRDGTGVHDSIVNQLLTKIDGVEALNNVLLIGMTNRKDLLDEALLRALTLEVLSTGVAGNYNGALQVMTAEFQVPSPLVPTRENYFVRYCKQHSDGSWAVVDVSLDSLRPNPISRTRRRPSGCLIQELPNGYSKVTWVEHMEVDDRSVHTMYKPLVHSGLAFGARRWVSTLERQCERLASSMASNIPASDLSVITSPEGRKSMLKLAERMVMSFCSGVGASTAHAWTTMSSTGSDDVRVMTRKSMDDPGRPPGIVLSAATSFWIPVAPKRVFDFLRDENSRSEWDILSNGGMVQEMAHIANGREPGNCVSLLRSLVEQRLNGLYDVL
ncbi:hypothetical protein DY000_02003171 [Brassica cretica]|uniref:Vesicle-fusing ATPase n=1 Tax=Brassica cretica TaxID=69181 RepID=A0ABQ7CKF7_BRACR|nr:hypothetical protein DY000_02003171 [Brassica cretica]